MRNLGVPRGSPSTEEIAHSKIEPKQYSGLTQAPTCDGIARTDLDEEVGSRDSDAESNRSSTGCQIRLMVATAVACLFVGFVGGRASLSDFPLLGKARNDIVSYYKTHELRLGTRNVRPDQYLTVFTTQIELINVSKKGDGWAPFQLAVSGNADERGAFCNDDDPNEDCRHSKKNPEWVNISGVWALLIDPEKELAPNERYEDQELIETRFQVTFTNSLDEPTLMHFHGLVPPNNLDGIPWISANPLQPNHTVFYDFVVYHRGFYWMHSHFGDHAGQGLFAPLIIKDHPDFRKSIGHPRDVLMIIYDAHWRAPCAYARHLYPDQCPVGGFDGWGVYTFNVNGRSLDRGGPAEIEVKPGEKIRLRSLEAGTMAVYRVHLGSLKGEVLALDGRRVKRGKFVNVFPMAGANRVDVLLEIPNKGGCFPIVATRASCVGTQEKTEQGALMLKTPGAICKTIQYKTDGVVPVLGWNDWMRFTGNLTALNSIIDPLKPPDVHHVVRLTGHYDNITGEWRPGFSINGKELRIWPSRVWCKVPEQSSLSADESVSETVLKMKQCQGEQVESNIPCDFFKCHNGTKYPRDQDGRCLPSYLTHNAWKGKPVSECHLWKIRPAVFHYNDQALEVCHGDRVWLTYADAGTMEGHPIHLHGTHQQLVQVNGSDYVGPLRDTWFMVKHSNITVAFDALNPGEWLLHCHIEHHLMNGMATTLRYVMDDRCRKRLYTQRKPNWQHTPPITEAAWPRTWNNLWQKKPEGGDMGWIKCTNGC